MKAILDWVALVLLIIGGLNWLLVGLFSIDLVAALFGTMTFFTRLIYILVGLAAIYVSVIAPKLVQKTATAGSSTAVRP